LICPWFVITDRYNLDLFFLFIYQLSVRHQRSSINNSTTKANYVVSMTIILMIMMNLQYDNENTIRMGYLILGRWKNFVTIYLSCVIHLPCSCMFLIHFLYVTGDIIVSISFSSSSFSSSF
jgi:hypothetical protein